MASDNTSSARRRILKAAAELFYTNGIQATGIDTIIERANIAKDSLYYHFESKNDLVVNYLKEQEDVFMASLEAVFEVKKTSAVQKIVTWFEQWEEQISHKKFQRGVAHLNALVEFPNPEHAIHIEAVAFRKRLIGKLAAVLKTNFKEPKQLATSLFFLIDSVHIAILHSYSSKNMKAMAETIMEHARSENNLITYNPGVECGSCGKLLRSIVMMKKSSQVTKASIEQAALATSVKGSPTAQLVLSLKSTNGANFWPPQS